MEADGLDEAILLWSDYRRFGLPHGKGPANETEDYINLIRAFEIEYDDVVAEKTREARENAKKK